MNDKERILKASPLELTVINHELLINSIDDALKASPKSEALSAALKKAATALATLYESLNLNVQLSQDLATLYHFINSILIKAAFMRHTDEKNDALTHAKTITQGLKDSWQTLHQNPNQTQAQPPTPQIFAGLTYDKQGNLTEYTTDDYNPNSGYKI